MGKVHCGSCAYLSDDEYESYCENPNNWELISNWRYRFRQYKQKPEEKNARNDCQGFKLVWYKRLWRLA